MEIIQIISIIICIISLTGFSFLFVNNSKSNFIKEDINTSKEKKL